MVPVSGKLQIFVRASAEEVTWLFQQFYAGELIRSFDRPINNDRGGYVDLFHYKHVGVYWPVAICE